MGIGRDPKRGRSQEVRKPNIYQHKAAVLRPLLCAWAAKLERQTRCPIDTAKATGKGPIVVEPPRTTSNERVFKLTGEPLYGGKGKHSGLTSNGRDTALSGVCIDAEDISQPDKHDDNQVLIGNEFKGLQQPCLQGTKSVVRGEDKTIMWRENKLRRQELRAEQPLISPWARYEGEAPAICPTDHAACPPHRNSMCPVGRALKHPAAKVLKEWATFGCPTRTGKPWTVGSRGTRASLLGSLSRSNCTLQG
jgi:hypothetical protein